MTQLEVQVESPTPAASVASVKVPSPLFKYSRLAPTLATKMSGKPSLSTSPTEIPWL